MITLIVFRFLVPLLLLVGPASLALWFFFTRTDAPTTPQDLQPMRWKPSSFSSASTAVAQVDTKTWLRTLLATCLLIGLVGIGIVQIWSYPVRLTGMIFCGLVPTVISLMLEASSMNFTRRRWGRHLAIFVAGCVFALVATPVIIRFGMEWAHSRPR